MNARTRFASLYPSVAVDRALRLTGLSAALLVLAPAISLAAETARVVVASQDTYLRGGKFATTPPTEARMLQLAARTGSNMTHVRKILLSFDLPKADLERATTARLQLAYNKPKKDEGATGRFEMPVRLYGVEKASWDQETATWKNITFHSPKSIDEKLNPACEFLGQSTIDTANYVSDGKLVIEDSRLLAFLRKAQAGGPVTLLITSAAEAESPVLMFFASEGTGKDDRKPQLQLQLPP